jgi:dihydrofolate reductase
MKLIAAVDNNWAIGNNGGLLVRIPNDQKRFREMTVGKVIVMGRKTLETFPQQQALASRKNIVLTRDKGFFRNDVLAVHSIEKLLDELSKYDDSDIFVVGGESVYDQLLPYCSEAYITKIDYEYQADAHMPNLDKSAEWEKVSESEEQTYFDLEYYFLKYEKVVKSSHK